MSEITKCHLIVEQWYKRTCSVTNKMEVRFGHFLQVFQIVKKTRIGGSANCQHVNVHQLSKYQILAVQECLS